MEILRTVSTNRAVSDQKPETSAKSKPRLLKNVKIKEIAPPRGEGLFELQLSSSFVGAPIVELLCWSYNCRAPPGQATDGATDRPIDFDMQIDQQPGKRPMEPRGKVHHPVLVWRPNSGL